MLDIRIPIGLLFVILGTLLTIFGWVTSSDTEMYAKSLDVNINIGSGLLMLVFGGLMLLWSKLDKSKK